MATNHTENYGLSQWTGTDAFSRLDFNADNLSVDAALKALADAVAAAPWVRIRSAVAGANTQTLSLDVSDVDFSQYHYVELILNMNLTPASTSTHKLRVNNISTQSYSVTNSSGGENTTDALYEPDILPAYGKSAVLRFIPFDSTAYVCCSVLISSVKPMIACCAAKSVTWAHLTSFDYTATPAVPVKAGSGMYLVGMRKP